MLRAYDIAVFPGPADSRARRKIALQDWAGIHVVTGLCAGGAVFNKKRADLLEACFHHPMVVFAPGVTGDGCVFRRVSRIGIAFRRRILRAIVLSDDDDALRPVKNLPGIEDGIDSDEVQEAAEDVADGP